LIGQTLGHYEILSPLGHGGMGEVYRARDTRLGREVAIKLLPDALTADPERRLRFQREAQSAAALQHPNIAVLHEIGEDGGILFLVMELVRGETLDRVVRQRKLTLQSWLAYAIPIADALAHAHRNGIAHRDLKPSNVMLTHEGHVKLLDFGLAKILERAGDQHQDTAELDTISQELTRAGKVMGTVSYMSPEQARGHAVDHRTDIFSLGVLLYQLATERLPFVGDSDVESLNATITLEPPALLDVVPDFAPEASRIVSKCMEKEPECRYQSADELVTDFRNLERDLGTGRVTTVGTSGPTQTAPKSTSKRPIAVGAVAVAIAAAIGLWQLVPFGDSTPTQEDETPTRIVVFPFDNLGAPDDEYFAAGVTEEIIGRLASISDLAVISRSSAFRYDRTGKSLQQIGEDFDVEYVLEGTVRWARDADGNRVRIAPELVRVDDRTSVWAESFDTPMDDIFGVQTRIAGRVIDAMGVVLVGDEGAMVATRPTENQEAYRAYLRGMDFLRRQPMRDRAEAEFQEAVDLDPDFAFAWAGLSRAHSWSYHDGEQTEARRRNALAAAEDAVRLAPTAPETRMALVLYHYRCYRDYDRALAELDRVLAVQPNSTEALAWKATINKRRGHFDEAVRIQTRVLELDPMAYGSATEMAVAHRLAGDFEQSAEAYELALSIAPHVDTPRFRRPFVYFAWKGTTAEARADLEAMSPDADFVGNYSWLWLEFFERRFDEALARARSLPEVHPGQVSLRVGPYYEALCLEQLGREDEAQAAWRAALDVLDRERQARPEDWRIDFDRAEPLAALGRADEALAAARAALDAMPTSTDAEAGISPLDRLFVVHVRLGQSEEAVEAFRNLAPGSFFTVPRLRLDARFADFLASSEFERYSGR
jgi:serine/threonine protein kinase/tetratricopeptide (TPR) repeat protein